MIIITQLLKWSITDSHYLKESLLDQKSPKTTNADVTVASHVTKVMQTMHLLCEAFRAAALLKIKQADGAYH